MEGDRVLNYFFTAVLFIAALLIFGGASLLSPTFPEAQQGEPLYDDVMCFAGRAVYPCKKIVGYNNAELDEN